MQKNDRSLDVILQERMVPLRIFVSSLFQKKEFNDDAYFETLAQLQKVAEKTSDLSPDMIKKQLALANQAFERGSVKDEIELDHPLLQFIWGTVLVRLASQPEQMQKWPAENQSQNGLVNSNLWEQIKKIPMMQNELNAYGVMLATRGFVTEKTKIRWGGADYPAVGYYFSPSENLVNLDVLWALVGGFEHMRSAVFHELAHASGTIDFPSEQKKLRQQIDEVQKKENKTPQDILEMRKMAHEHEMRHYIFDEAENSFANGFAVMLTNKELVQQDLGFSLNSLETALFGIGDTVLNPNKSNESKMLEEEQTVAMKEFTNLKKVIRYAFFSNNELFDSSVESFERVGIDIQALKGTDKAGKPIQGKTVLNELLDFSSKMQALQIPVAIHSRRLSIQEKIKDAFDERARLSEDIYDRFAKEIADRIWEDIKDKQEEQSKQGQGQQQGQEGQSQQSQGQQQGQEGQSQQSQGQQQGQEGQSQQSQGQQQGQEGQSQQSQGQQQGQEGQSQQSQGQQQGQEGKTKDDREKSSSQKGQGQQQEQKITSEQLGKAIDELLKKEDLSKSNPQEDRVNSKKTNDKDKGETPQEIADRKEKEGSKNKDAGNNSSSEDSSTNYAPSLEDSYFNEPEYQRDNHLYNQIIAENASVLRHLKKLFSQLQNEYLDETGQKTRELLPASSLQGSLDISSIVNRVQREATGQRMRIDDYKHFDQKTKPACKKAPIDICVFIDISGSVEAAGKSKCAIEIGCLIYEAVKRFNSFNVYVGLMTRPVKYVAVPGMDDKEVADRLSTLYSGSNWDGCGDKIASATQKTLEEIQKRRPTTEKEGFTHFFYVTDSQHTDEEISRPMIETLLKNSKTTTFNWITFPHCHSMLNTILDNFKDAKGTALPLEERIDMKEDIVPAFQKLLSTRIHQMKQKQAFETRVKKSLLSDAIDRIKR